MNEEQAFPSVDVVCADRVRKFSLNLGAFRAISEHIKKATNNPKFNILKDFDWNNQDFDTQILIMFGGFFTDARKHDQELWTIEKCEEVVSILSFKDIETCITASLQRVLSDDQLKKLQSEQEGQGKKGRPKKAKA